METSQLLSNRPQNVFSLGIPQDPFKLVKLSLVLLILIFPSLSKQAHAQDNSIQQIEESLKTSFGLDKLKALNRLTAHYQKRGDRKALRYGRQAVSLGEKIFVESNTIVGLNEQPQLLRAYFQLGEIYYLRENYFGALENLEASQAMSEALGQNSYNEKTDRYLTEINDLIASGQIKENFLSRTFNDIKIGEVFSGATNDLTIQSQINLGQADEKKGAYDKAMKHYLKAINLLKNKGDAEKINELNLKIAFMLDSLDQHTTAQKFLTEVIVDMDNERITSATSFIENEIVTPVLPEIIRPSGTASTSRSSNRVDKPSNRVDKRSLRDLSERFAREKDFEKSLAYYKMYNELSQKMTQDSLYAASENQRREDEILMLKQQKQIADLNVKSLEQEREKQVKLRNTYLLIAFLVLISSFVTLFFYLSKRRQHKRLEFAYFDLDKTKNKLAGAEQKIVKLLRQQVSGDVAMELLTNNTDKPGERCFVCIMFLDIRDFTPMAEKLSPEEIIAYQNNVFGFMIDIVQQHNGNINQLLGDGFMATFGAPVSKGNDCQNAFEASKAILHELKERSQAGVIPKTKVGIGLHAGYVVTGNVGNEKRKQYSVTGNPVIIASRVEQLNKTYKSQLIITEEVCQKLDKPLNLNQPFLEVEVKGRSNPVKILKIA